MLKLSIVKLEDTLRLAQTRELRLQTDVITSKNQCLKEIEDGKLVAVNAASDQCRDALQKAQAEFEKQDKSEAKVEEALRLFLGEQKLLEQKVNTLETQNRNLSLELDTMKQSLTEKINENNLLVTSGLELVARCKVVEIINQNNLDNKQQSTEKQLAELKSQLGLITAQSQTFFNERNVCGAEKSLLKRQFNDSLAQMKQVYTSQINNLNQQLADQKKFYDDNQGKNAAEIQGNVAMILGLQEKLTRLTAVGDRCVAEAKKREEGFREILASQRAGEDTFFAELDDLKRKNAKMEEANSDGAKLNMKLLSALNSETQELDRCNKDKRRLSDSIIQQQTKQCTC